jgi:hypothetical protein
MDDTHFKPYLEKVAEQERRAVQTRDFRRNQAIGLVLVAAAVLLWRLLHTHPGWLFPQGWWRL